MQTHFNILNYKIVYFSGTGGTKRAAELLSAALVKENRNVNLLELNGKEMTGYDKEDMLIVIFPVYALNAPKPIYEYIHSLAAVKQTPAVVISVSGGGEVSPNTACRLRCIKCLEQKGYKIVYENMLVMPSNIFVKTPDELAIYLLKILPTKIKKITTDILSSVTSRIRPQVIDRVLSAVAVLEQSVSKKFAQHLKISNNCSGCGLCVRSCPSGNIRMENNIPVFHNRCLMCLKCVYDCPKMALQPRWGKIVVLKQGYNLAELEKRLDGEKYDDLNTSKIESLAKGYLFSGVKKYLMK